MTTTPTPPCPVCHVETDWIEVSPDAATYRSVSECQSCGSLMTQAVIDSGIRMGDSVRAAAAAWEGRGDAMAQVQDMSSSDGEVYDGFIVSYGDDAPCAHTPGGLRLA